ncbi:MAG TPA: glycosidase [Anaerolineae bacterium]|nr:glycosidase [Anaerolineae bacterium]
MRLQRYAGNPVLEPRREHPWEARAVFNCAVVHHNGLFHMLYRAVAMDLISTIGYAVSSDGFDWLRLDRPVLEPASESDTKGVEDPRITRLGDTFYMVYVAYSEQGMRISLAASSNLIAWERLGVILPDEDNKNAVLFPEKIGGRYYLLHRRLPDIWVACSDDLLHWTDHRVIMRTRPGTWEALKIGAAGPPIKTDQGWLFIYHGFGEDKVYRLGVALLDLNDPTVVLKRQKEPILEPEEAWELHGDVPDVVFSCGQVMTNEVLYVYYGGADRVIGVAMVGMPEVLDFIRGEAAT